MKLTATRGRRRKTEKTPKPGDIGWWEPKHTPVLVKIKNIHDGYALIEPPRLISVPLGDLHD